MAIKSGQSIKPGRHKWSLTCHSCGTNFQELELLRKLAEAADRLHGSIGKLKDGDDSVPKAQFFGGGSGGEYD